MIPNGYSSDRTGFGEPIQCWRSDFFDSMTVITLNAEMREIELRRRIGGHDNCNERIDLDVILELLRRAGFVVQEPEAKQ